ncbi:hypothetical protein BS47DRAFT_1413520 [Hydnum rufescens UP504]|uniref:DEAD/DEAH-box helicase domain-containing protein n=1 Tax=Hydnum rufescens UP504 TaxID=1448309 RepID=A0A9P6AP06_9AGAM|nr:hypothetical protein BS47DRAFT_1413520 [Hydnum rufescens UP504]
MTNVFIGAPTGIGKTICTEFSLLRLWSKSDAPCAVCIEPYQDVVDQRVSEWRKKFGNLQGREEIVGLTGVTSADLRILEKGARVFVHPVSASGDEVQLIGGGEIGPTCEVVISDALRVCANRDQDSYRCVWRFFGQRSRLR